MVMYDILIGKKLKDVVRYPEANYMREIAVMTTDENGENKIIGEAFSLKGLLAEHPESKEMKIVSNRVYLGQLVLQVKEDPGESV